MSARLREVKPGERPSARELAKRAVADYRDRGRLGPRELARIAVQRYRARRPEIALVTDAQRKAADETVIFETINGQITIDNYDGWRRQLTWRQVFECKENLNRQGAATRAREGGYRFFAYDGQVFFVDYKGLFEPTGYTVQDVTENSR